MDRIVTIILLILLSTIISKKAKSQGFVPYIDSTTVWYDNLYGASGIIETSITSEYYVAGDTVINSSIYYKIYANKIDSTWYVWTGNLIVTYSNEYTSAIREDSTKKFYIVYKNDSIEKILFDFDLNVGDTLPTMVFNEGCNNPPMTVIAIDTVFLGIQPLKRFYFYPSWLNKTLIEGIGSSGGLIWQGSHCMFIESAMCMLAFKKGNDSIAIQCSTPPPIVGINDNLKKEIKLYPNPAKNIINIKGDLPRNSTFLLYNQLGNLIYSQLLTSNQIQFFELIEGFYYYEIYSQNEIVCNGKLIIIE